MKIECPYADCQQRISISIFDAGTEAPCPACQRPLTCPSYDEFPDEEKPSSPQHQPKRRSTSLRGGTPLDRPQSKSEAIRAIPGGGSLMFGSVLLQIQIVVPMLLIALGAGLLQNWILFGIVLIVGNLLQRGATLILKQGWSVMAVFFAVLLEAAHISIRVYEIVADQLSGDFVQTLPEFVRLSYPAIVWITLGVAILALGGFLFGFRAALAIDGGALKKWDKP